MIQKTLPLVDVSIGLFGRSGNHDVDPLITSGLVTTKQVHAAFNGNDWVVIEGHSIVHILTNPCKGFVGLADEMIQEILSISRLEVLAVKLEHRRIAGVQGQEVHVGRQGRYERGKGLID